MKKVLINKYEEGKICDVANVGEEFEVHPDFQWVDCPHDDVTLDWVFTESDGVYVFSEFDVSQHEIDPEQAEMSFKIAREIGYGTIGAQLDMLYKEIITNGSISADGEWAQHITAVKTNIPKK